MKALEKDRARRYDTANGLASDIQRHLNNEPVVARPPSNFYRFQKLVRRNKLAFAAASAVAAALVLGLAISTWMFFREREAKRDQAWLFHEAESARKSEAKHRQQAQGAAAKSEQVAQFLKDMLQGVGPEVALGRDTTILRQILDKTADRLGQDFKGQPEVEAELRDTLGGVYLELGLYDKAEPMLREALALRSKLFGNAHRDVANSLTLLGNLLHRQGKLDEAVSLHRQALQLRRDLLGNDHPDVAQSLDNLAGVILQQGKLSESGKHPRQALELRKKRLGDEHSDVATSLANRASVLRAEGKLTEADSKNRQALAIHQKLFGREHP